MFPTNIYITGISVFMLFGSPHVYLHYISKSVRLSSCMCMCSIFRNLKPAYMDDRCIKFSSFFYIWGACAINFIPHHNTLQFRRLLQAPTSTPEVDVTYTYYILYTDDVVLYIYICYVYINPPVYRLSSLVSPLFVTQFTRQFVGFHNIFS